MSVETKRAVAQPSIISRMSNESFLTLIMVGVLLVLFGIAAVFVPNFYLPQNMLNLITNNWYIIILGIGVTFLLITGNFDLSVGGVIALTGVLAVYFSQAANVSQNVLANGLGLPYGVAVGLALLGAMSIGALNAFFVVRLRVPSIIVTLGTMMVARGIAQVITQGAQRNTSLPDAFGVVGSVAIPGTSIRLPSACHGRAAHRRLHL
jgi:ribose transport system permease protein